jgi:hypothetical protein
MELLRSDNVFVKFRYEVQVFPVGELHNFFTASWAYLSLANLVDLDRSGC